MLRQVARGAFCETTIGYRIKANGETFRRIFHAPMFQVTIVDDVPGVEVCGALKNVVALAAGFVDGMGLGDNTKAAIIRLGLAEMMRFIRAHFPDVKDDTFFQSCGIADLVVTCYGGRNRLCAAEFVRSCGEKTFAELEAELLGGQKLQGTGTCGELVQVLKREGTLDDYPLFKSIHAIAFESAPAETMIASLAF